MTSNKLYKILFALYAALAALVLIQGFTHFIPLSLNGYVKTAEPVRPTWQSYKDNSLQNYLDAYARENCGFREFYIKSYNQFEYSAFHKITNNNLMEGKDKEIFLKMYVDEVTGKNLRNKFQSVEEAKREAQKNVESTLALIDTLKSHGTEFLVVVAPSKTSVYPELMPDSIQKQIPEFDLQKYYAELFKANNINHIDFLSYFKKIKNTVQYPLYTRYGTHWAESILPKVTDSILRKLELTTNFKFPGIEITDENVTDEYSKQDGELEKQMNLLFPLHKPALPRPICALKNTELADKPKLLVIADSYFVQLNESCFNDCFGEVNYWKYNKEIISTNPSYKGYVQYFPSTYKVIEEADIVMVIFTSVFSTNYLFGFIETAQKAFLEKDSAFEERNIQNVIMRIKSDPKWLQAIEKQAKERNISLEKALRNNALYVIRNGN